MSTNGNENTIFSDNLIGSNWPPEEKTLIVEIITNNWLLQDWTTFDILSTINTLTKDANIEI